MILQWLKRFMAGRYGTDKLYYFLLVGGILLMTCARFTSAGSPWLSILFSLLSWVAVALGFFRVFSRNTQRRFEENRRFEELWRKLQARVRGLGTLRTHKHLRCPQCKQKIRVPRGRGKIMVTCPKCKQDFIQKT